MQISEKAELPAFPALFSDPAWYLFCYGLSGGKHLNPTVQRSIELLKRCSNSKCTTQRRNTREKTHFLSSQWCLIITASETATQAVKAMIPSVFASPLPPASKPNKNWCYFKTKKGKTDGIVILLIVLPAPEFLEDVAK